jgi:fibronectin type 3 domain-containing protein
VLIGDPTLRVNVCSPPVAIDNLSSALADGDICLWWAEPFSECGVERYVVYRSTSPDAVGDSLESTPDTIYTDMGAAGDVGSNYFYTIKAVDVVGNKSAGSNQVGECDVGLINVKK